MNYIPGLCFYNILSDKKSRNTLYHLNIGVALDLNVGGWPQNYQRQTLGNGWKRQVRWPEEEISNM